MCCSTGGGRQARGVGAEPARAQAETGVRRHHRYHPLPWGAGTRPRTLPPRRGTTCPPATSGRVVAGAPRRSGQRPLTAAGTRACSRPQGPPHPRPPCSSLIQRPGRQPGPSAAGRCDSPPPVPRRSLEKCFGSSGAGNTAVGREQQPRLGIYAWSEHGLAARVCKPTGPPALPAHLDRAGRHGARPRPQLARLTAFDLLCRAPWGGWSSC